MLSNGYATIKQQIVLHHILLHTTSSKEISLFFLVFINIVLNDAPKEDVESEEVFGCLKLFVATI